MANSMANAPLYGRGALTSQQKAFQRMQEKMVQRENPFVTEYAHHPFPEFGEFTKEQCELLLEIFQDGDTVSSKIKLRNFVALIF
jgi:hypothetical protein